MKTVSLFKRRRAADRLLSKVNPISVFDDILFLSSQPVGVTTGRRVIVTDSVVTLIANDVKHL